jgi:flagellar biosynthesis component FlhA
MYMFRTPSLIVSASSALASLAQIPVSTKQFVYQDQPESLTKGYIAAVVILSIVAVGLVAILVMVWLGNQAYFAQKAVDDGEAEEDRDEEMQQRGEDEGEEEEDAEEEDAEDEDAPNPLMHIPKA